MKKLEKVGLVLIIMGVVGGVAIWWFLNILAPSYSDVATVSNDSDDVIEIGIVPPSGHAEPQYSESEVCTAGPWMTDIGRHIYPTSERYPFAFIGELFTAADCDDRIEQLFGVENGNYTLGATIRLKRLPSSDLRNILTDIGFQCTEIIPDGCTIWTLDDLIVPVSEILRIKPFSDQIESVDCSSNCG